jgi:SAM-dependent methyltransferase
MFWVRRCPHGSSIVISPEAVARSSIARDCYVASSYPGRLELPRSPGATRVVRSYPARPASNKTWDAAATKPDAQASTARTSCRMAMDPQHAVMHEYYELGKEAERLSTSGAGRLEFERTQEIVLRRLPPPPATVADIGGGPGRYALWLAGLGYRVLHRDLVPLHVAQVRTAATGLGHPAGQGEAARAVSLAEVAGPPIESAVGDARSLDLADARVDAVLLLGPLYHLTRRADRVQALREAGRVVRPGGPVFGAAISRWAARLDGMLRLRIYEQYPNAADLIGLLERTGVLPPLSPAGFNGFTHRPRQLRAEFSSAGLDVADLVCVEGAAFLLNDLDDRVADGRAWQVILDSARAHERVPELLGVGPHLLATGIRR